MSSVNENDNSTHLASIFLQSQKQREQAISYEQQLLVELRNGETDVFLKLVIPYEQHIYNLGLRLLVEPEQAEEVLQETFLRALKGLNSFRGEAGISTWLYRIAANVAFDLLKRKIKLRQHEINIDFDTGLSNEVSIQSSNWEAQWSDPDYRVDPEAVALLLEQRKLLEQALARLPEQQRLVVVLHDQVGMTVAEIAASASIPLPTAKSNLRRGRMTLVSILARFDDEYNYRERALKSAQKDELR